MEVTSTGIFNGCFEDKYGKRSKINIDGVPSLSIPFSIINAPSRTVSFAIILEDKDAIPVCGKTWIHWLAANIKTTNIHENASQDNPHFVQGRNSWDKNMYGGMMPPDAPHKYDLKVYALEKFLELKNGFTKKELEKTMDGYVLKEFTLSAVYSNED